MAAIIGGRLSPSRLGPALIVSGAALALEWGRVVLTRQLEWPGAALAALLTLVFIVGACRWLAIGLRELGLVPGRSLGRGAGILLGGLALTVVLLLPAAVRWTGQAPPGGVFTAIITLVALAEEVLFRGVLLVVLLRATGPLSAIVLTTAAWVAAHALSHPPQFLFAVAGAGLVLGLWRLYTRDLVAPVIAHVLADVLQ